MPAPGYGVAVVVGLYLATLMLWYMLPIVSKAAGRAELCPWSRLVASAEYGRRMLKGRTELNTLVKFRASDELLAIDSWQVPRSRDFWLPRPGRNVDGKQLLSYLLADHAFLDEQYRSQGVRAGDIVLDCGAHVGVFADRALRRVVLPKLIRAARDGLRPQQSCRG